MPPASFAPTVSHAFRAISGARSTELQRPQPAILKEIW